jgi:probable rRNA maturation factor
LNVNYFYKSTSFRLVKGKEYNKLIDNIIKREGSKGGEINIIFTSDKPILNLNKKFLGRNYPTDVIVFSNSFKNIVAGEVYISIERVRENSIIYSEGNFEKELKRIIIHGILHLIGYDDRTKKDKDIMTGKEELYLQL